MEFIIDKDYDDTRIDKFLRKQLEQLPLGEIFKLFRKGDVKINGKKAKEIREILYKKENSRKNLELCKQCDVLVEKLDGIPYTNTDITNQWENLYSIFNIQ